MLYSSLKFLMKFVLRVYYKKVFLLHEDRIPYNKPYIFACNHPNAFTDAILIAALTKKELHFLARSDVFNNKLNTWLLGLMNLIPIYRIREGAASVKKNEQTFHLCYDILSKGHSILIFSEGISIQEKKLRPLKKGTARIAFGAIEQNSTELDLQIIPVGINYTHPNNFRKEVIISFGDAIPVHDHHENYLINKAKGMNQLNEILDESISEQMIIVDKGEREKVADIVLEIARNNHPRKIYPWNSKNSTRLLIEKLHAKKINTLSETDFSQLSNMSTDFISKIQALNVEDSCLVSKEKSSLAQIFLLLLMAPLAIAGAISNAIPFILTKTISSKFVTKGEFYSGVNIGAGSVLFIIFYTIITVILIKWFGWIGILLNGIPLFLGYFSLHWWETLCRKFALRKVSKLRKSENSKLINLLKLREDIFELSLNRK